MPLPLLAAAIVPALTNAVAPALAQAFGNVAQKVITDLLNKPDRHAEAKLSEAEKRELDRLRYEQQMARIRDMA